MRSILVLLACAVACVGLSGCGAVALPSRTTADAARMLPVLGDAVTMPFDAVGNTIDRGTAAAREQDAASLEQNARHLSQSPARATGHAPPGA